MLHTNPIRNNIQLIRSAELSTILPFSPSFYNGAVKKGRFPEPIKTKEWGKHWDVADIYAVISKAAGKPVSAPERAVNLKEIKSYLPRSDAWYWGKVKDGTMPTPFKLFSRTFWLESEIIEWLDQLE